MAKWLKAALAWTSVAALGGLGVGVVAQTMFFQTGYVELEPHNVEIAVDPLQFQTVTVHLQLTNRSSRAMVVRRADTSCGCASLVTRGGRELVSPLEVAPWRSAPWQVAIETQGRVGRHEFMVSVETDLGGRVSRQVSKIAMYIRPAVAVKPRVLEFTADGWCEAEIQVFDAYADPGLEIDAIVVSDPQRMRITRSQIAPMALDVTPKYDGADTEFAMKLRHMLMVSYEAPATAPRSRVYDDIKLTFKEGRHPQVVVPVTCRVAQPAYTVAPNRVSLTAHSFGKTLERRIRCTIRQDVVSTLRVLRAPAYVSAEIIDVEAGVKELRLTIATPKDADGISDGEAIVIGNADGTAAFTIPIEVVPTF